MLAVDPASKRGGGAILGDKTRMTELGRAPAAFIRPSSAGDRTGGVARHTREAILLCEAAGFDAVLVETMGVGQAETAVAEIVDMFVLILPPASGDELQGIKRGVVELADLVLVNKADGELAAAAHRSAADYANALRLLRPPLPEWQVPVRAISALEGIGIGEVWDDVARFRAALEQTGACSRRAVVGDRRQPPRPFPHRTRRRPKPRGRGAGGHGRHPHPHRRGARLARGLSRQGLRTAALFRVG